MRVRRTTHYKFASTATVSWSVATARAPKDCGIRDADDIKVAEKFRQTRGVEIVKYCQRYATCLWFVTTFE